MQATDMPDERALTVTELTRRIRGTLETAFGPLRVEGELSNIRRPTSGHCYGTLKDEGAQISFVIWRGELRHIRADLRDGAQVRVHGDLTVYEKGGQYQLVVHRIEPAGLGARQAAFEALKKKLAAEGLFDPARKRPIPLLPQHIGVVTSPTGAAIRDILRVIERRFPNLHIVIAPARVQGDGAAEEIAEAIGALNRLGGFDVLIVARGGGSVEDLWAFNEEAVARAVAQSVIPVISAVGHETDFTICDFVADLRAPTPSAAAEMVVNRKDAFNERITEWRRRLAGALTERLLRLRARYAAVHHSHVFREPAYVVKERHQQLSVLRQRMRHELQTASAQRRQRLDENALRALHAIQHRRETAMQQVEALHRHLRGLNPLAVLERGYSFTTTAAGRPLRAAADIRPGEQMHTCLARGWLESEVTKTHEQKETG